MDRPSPKEVEEKLAHQYQAQTQQGVMGLTDRPAVPHPRELLLAEMNDQEQRLLDKLVALREAKNEILFLSREEGERMLKISLLMQRATYP